MLNFIFKQNIKVLCFVNSRSTTLFGWMAGLWILEIIPDGYRADTITTSYAIAFVLSQNGMPKILYGFNFEKMYPAIKACRIPYPSQVSTMPREISIELYVSHSTGSMAIMPYTKATSNARRRSLPLKISLYLSQNHFSEKLRIKGCT